MGTMNISLPDAMRDFVDGQVAEKGYGTSSEYVRDLIRREQDRLALRTLLLDGASAPVVSNADRAFFDELRAYARAPAGDATVLFAREPESPSVPARRGGSKRSVAGESVNRGSGSVALHRGRKSSKGAAAKSSTTSKRTSKARSGR